MGTHPRSGRAAARRMSLARYFDEFHLPNFLFDRRPRYWEAMRDTLRWWRRLLGEASMAQIDNAALANFRAGLEASGRLARVTINKHLRHLSAILNKAGPVGPRNRDALGVLRRVPWTRPYSLPRRLPRYVSDEDVAVLYRHAGAALAPHLAGVKPCDWWRALIVTASVTGFRRSGLLGLLWQWIDFERGEIRLGAEADKCHADRVKPIGPLTLRHLARIRTDSPRVFAWPHTWTTFYRSWHAIQTAAGVDRANHLKLHDLKRACLTRAACSGASPHAIMLLGDHSQLRTSEHYVNATPELVELALRSEESLARLIG